MIISLILMTDLSVWSDSVIVGRNWMWVTIGASRVKRKAIKLYSSRSNFKIPVQAGKKAFKFSIDQMTQLKQRQQQQQQQHHNAQK